MDTDTKLQHYYYIFIVLGAAGLTLLIFWPFLTAVVLGPVFAIVVKPVHRWIKRILRHNGWSAFVTVVLTVIVVLAPLLWFGWQIVHQAGDFYSSLDTSNALGGFAQKAAGYLEHKLGVSISSDIENVFNIKQYLLPAFNWLVGHAGLVVGGAARLLLNAFFVLAIMFLMLRDGAKFKKRFIELSPLPNMQDKRIFNTMKASINSVVRGALIIALVQGIVAGVGYSIFNVPNAAFWGGVTALSAMVPGIGTALIIAPVVGYLLITGAFSSALGMAIWGIVAVGFIDNILGPKIWGRGIKVPKILILISVLGGIQLFGAVGFILGPIVISLLFALLDIYPVISKS